MQLPFMWEAEPRNGCGLSDQGQHRWGFVTPPGVWGPLSRKVFVWQQMEVLPHQPFPRLARSGSLNSYNALLRSQPPGYLASGIGGDHRRRTVRAVCTWTGGKEDAASRPALGVRVLWPLVHYLLLCLPEGHGWAQVSLILQIFPFTVSPYSRSFLLLLLMMTLLEGSSPHPNTRIRGSLWPLQSPQPHEQHLAYCRGSVSIYRVIKWRNESTEVILLTSASTHSEACCLKLSPNALTLPYSIALTLWLANCELFLTRLFLFFSTPCDPIVYL